MVSAMARGTRAKGGKSGSALDTFANGTVTLFMRPTRDLQTLREFAIAHPRRELASNVIRFGAASILAELILQHTAEDPSPTIYHRLEQGLDSVRDAQDDAIVETLLMTAWMTVDTLGYRPTVERCVRCGKPVPEQHVGRLDFGSGGLRCEACSSSFDGPRLGPRAREQILAFLSGAVPIDLDRPRAHLRILAAFVAYHVSHGNIPRSFRFLEDLLPADAVTEDTS